MSDASSPKRGRPRGSGSFPWRAFFQQTSTPVFVLGKGRRLRFANTAWEKLTGVKLADALGMVCSPRRHSSPLGAALAPSPEVQHGKPAQSRRPAPNHRSGPPWWDITFAPLAVEDGHFGIVGFIAVVDEHLPAAARKVPASIGTLREQHALHFSLDLFAGNAPGVERFQGQLRHAAHSTAPVWLWGEPGSGKETAARVIHHAGPHRERAFVGIDCTGLQPYLIESLLFGHGGLLAAGHIGTLYLKEPAGLPRDLQQRLADVFAEPHAPRLISASVRPSSEDVMGKLIPEFFTVFSVVELRVPPLRERLADLPRLVATLHPGAVVETAVFEVLRVQPWPGNIRELSRVLAEAITTAADGRVGVNHLPQELRVRAKIAPQLPKLPALNLETILQTVEARVIGLALARTRGNATKAAELLGIGRARVVRQVRALQGKAE